MESHSLPIAFRLHEAIARARALRAEARATCSQACEARLCARNNAWLARQERARSEELEIHCLLYMGIKALVLQVIEEKKALKRKQDAPRSVFVLPGLQPALRADAAFWQWQAQLLTYKGSVQ
ncbi:MAG TPA: hypothetical protein VKU00_04890 [Chthonomonadaceae bacterium]|nr:hypothetical protein [Chthonomonadaceae bacterium]